MTNTYEVNGAYFLPDGTEVIYRGKVEHGERRWSDGRVETYSGDHIIRFPRDYDRLSEDLGDRTLSPRMVTCDEGHTYHLIVENFPVTKGCPVCAVPELEEAFRSHNWFLAHTGGGCTAWQQTYEADDGTTWTVWVTNDLSAPRTTDEICDYAIGVYQIGFNGEWVSEEGEWFHSWELAGWVRKPDAPSREEWPGTPPGMFEEWNEWVADTGVEVTLNDPEIHALREREDIPQIIKSWVFDAVTFVSGEDYE